MPAPDKFPELFKPWCPGQVINGLYRIEEEIARGGMGVVHKATDLATNKYVVIKSMLPEVAQVVEYKKRFIRESEEWVELGAHPNIVRAYTAHEIGYLPRLVLEYVDGCSLDDLMTLAESPALDLALDIAVQICWGMAYAHDKELIHRDLKPANILVGEDRTVKITDFGLVKRIMEEAEKQLAMTNEVPPLQTLMTQGVMGTPEYIAPEQWQGETNQSSDIYAFGIILYEMFCGQRPFDYSHLKGEERITAYQTAHCKEPLPEPRSIQEDLPEPIEQLIMQCLEKEPAKRPKSFREIISGINKTAKQLIGKSFRRQPDPKELDRHARLDQANAFLRLGKGCLFRGDYDKALDLSEKAHNIFEAENDQKGICHYYDNLCEIYFNRGDYERANDMCQRSLDINKRLDVKKGIAICYNTMGIILRNQGDFNHALDITRKSLEISDAISDEEGQGVCYNNMGMIYCNLGNNDQAMAMHVKSLEIYKKLDDQAGISKSYNNMGNIFWRDGDYNRAQEMYSNCIEIFEGLGERASLSLCYYNLGTTFSIQKNYNQALEMLQKGLNVAQDLQNKKVICMCLAAIGQVYSHQGQTDKALDILGQGLALMKEIGHHRQSEVEDYITELTEKSNNQD
ncbi:tetratricopeptide repeat protein [Planctomycetota bacterium]